jgi:hypothetical protein
VSFTLAEESPVTFTVSGVIKSQWVSFDAPTLLCDDATYAPIALIAAKAALKTILDNAATKNTTANVGDAAFQIPAAAVSAFTSAVETAQSVYDDAEATKTTVEDATSYLTAAIDTYDNAELNAPADGTVWYLTKKDGWTYDGKAITFIAGGRTDAGGYNVQYLAEPNSNLAQQLTLTKVEGNVYTISITDSDGNTRYLSTGVPYGGNTSQIRTTTTASDAAQFKFIATATEGIYNIYNVAADNYIGAQDAGVFTVNSHINFEISEASKASIAVNTTAAGWGTLMVPFSGVAVAEGVNVYTCTDVEDNGYTLTLTALEDETLAANTPYIVEGSWNDTFEGWGTATKTAYTTGLLTGTYADMDAANGTYVLQNQNDKVGFYLVNTDIATPKVKANRAYLTAPTAAGTNAFFFPEEGDMTAINAIEAMTSGTAQIFDASGVQQQRLQKGLNIIHTQDGKNVKVMVK